GSAAGFVRRPGGDLRDHRPARGVAAVSRRRAAARRSRPVRLSEAPGIARRRRPPPADGVSALLQGAACLLAGDAPMSGAIEPVVGRYLHLDYAGRRYRLYFESAGEGIPLLCLHTAG